METSSSSSSWPRLDLLPFETLIHICTYLQPDFIVQVLSQVCVRFRILSSDEALWKIRMARRWPARYPATPPSPSFNWSQACVEREKFAGMWSDYENTTSNVVLKSHLSSVDSVLLMDQGRLLLTGSRDRALALWNTDLAFGDDTKAHQGLLLKDIQTHKGWIWTLNYCAEKSLVVSGGWDNMVHVWNLGESGSGGGGGLTHNFQINCKAAVVTSHLLNPDLLAVGTFLKKVRVYDIRQGDEPVESYHVHTMPVLSVCSVPYREHLLLSASEDSSIALIDRRSRKLLKRLHLSDGFPMRLAAFENVLYAADKSGNLYLIDLSVEGQLLQVVRKKDRLHKDIVTGLSAGMGGVVTVSSDSYVKLLHADLDASVIASVDTKHLGQVTSVSYMNGYLATGHSIDSVQIWRDVRPDRMELPPITAQC